MLNFEQQPRFRIPWSCCSNFLPSPFCSSPLLPQTCCWLQLFLLLHFLLFVFSVFSSHVRISSSLSSRETEVSYFRVLGTLEGRDCLTKHEGSRASWSSIKLWMFGARHSHHSSSGDQVFGSGSSPEMLQKLSLERGYWSGRFHAFYLRVVIWNSACTNSFEIT